MNTLILIGALKNSKIFLGLFLIHNIATSQSDHFSSFVFGQQSLENPNDTITTLVKYEDNVGYGFDFNTFQNARIISSGLKIDNKPVYFSVAVPEGNYKVDITFKSAENDIDVVVKAESRRLFLDTILSKQHKITKSFLVNVRTPKIDSNQQIIRKERELTYLNWDNKLTLEFLGTAIIHKIIITSVSQVRTIYLAGDSTVTDQDLEPWASWGQFFTAYLNTNVVVANYAYSGASLNSFKGSHRLDKLGTLMQKGDYLFIQFGHNDQKQNGKNDGPWLNYTDLLVEFITVAREKGAIPILVTPVQRRLFDSNGLLISTHGDYPDAMRKVSQKWNVPLIDLTKITTILYESWGEENSKKAFVQYPANTFPGQTEKLEDNTHFNSFGANEIALCVIQEIKNQALLLSGSLKKNITEYNASKPNQFNTWSLPLSNRFEPVQPEGN